MTDLSAAGATQETRLADRERRKVVVQHEPSDFLALDEIERRAKYKTWDVPDGKGGHTWRWTRDAAPVRITLVNGVATFEDGKPTGARPGDMVTPRDRG